MVKHSMGGTKMKVFVVGANGQIGRKVCQLLKASEGHEVRAMVRTEEQVAFFQEKGIEAVVANLEGTVSQIAEAAKGCDAIVFTAGSGGHTGADKTLLIDLDGAVKTIEAAQKANIDRFVMVSALQAHNRENWNEKIRHYYVAKHYADRILQESNLTYTILRPGGLTNELGTGNVAMAENLPRATISRADVAQAVFNALTDEKTFRRSFDLIQAGEELSEK